MKTSHFFVLLGFICAAPQMTTTGAILTAIWFFGCGIYYIVKEG